VIRSVILPPIEFKSLPSARNHHFRRAVRIAGRVKRLGQHFSGFHGQRFSELLAMVQDSFRPFVSQDGQKGLARGRFWTSRAIIRTK
jgi:hypothetical protein